jgi:hypothetical protein
MRNNLKETGTEGSEVTGLGFIPRWNRGFKSPGDEQLAIEFCIQNN